MQASRPRIATAVGAIAAKMSALQAYMPVILTTVSGHQLVRHALCILGRCAAFHEQGLSRH